MKLPRFSSLGLGLFVWAGTIIAPSYAGVILLSADRSAGVYAGAINADPEATPPDFFPITKSKSGAGSFSGASVANAYASPYPAESGGPTTAHAEIEHDSEISAQQITAHVLAAASVVLGAGGQGGANAGFTLAAVIETTVALAYHLTFDADHGYVDFYRGTPGGLNLALDGSPVNLSGVLTPGKYFLNLGVSAESTSNHAVSMLDFGLTLKEVGVDAPTHVPDTASTYALLGGGLIALAAFRRRVNSGRMAA